MKLFCGVQVNSDLERRRDATKYPFNMAVVLLKIIEDAHFSGELKLSGRKLKDFPKAAAKYNLSDTVIAG